MEGDGGDEGGGGEEDADGDLFGEAMSAAGGVDENEVAEEESAEQEVKVDGFGGEPEKERGESYGGEQNSREEGGAVAVVEVVAGFEVLLVWGLAVEEASVEKAVGGVEHPDSDEHRQDGGEGKADVVGGGDEPDPEGGYSGSVEREEMPEVEGGSMAGGRRLGSCGRSGMRQGRGCRGL
jgi:hypothetical protein